MKFPRGSGILLHISSLPGKYGIGDLGPAAYEFIDILEAAGQIYWQILPLSPTGHGNSPYSSHSAFAGNTLLISPEMLAADGLIDADELNGWVDRVQGQVDFVRVSEWRTKLLQTAYERYRTDPNSLSENIKTEFERFCRENFWWLDDHAAFVALKRAHDGAPWFEWSEALRLRTEGTLRTVTSQYQREIAAEQFAQFLFFRQWSNVREYANARNINIVGDMPIFVAHDSADVWCNRSKFKLDEDGMPTVVAGVPPDYFSKTGQLWGNPIYDWTAMIDDDLGWWNARIAFALRTVNILRLDHFIGFVRNWEVPAGDETAENGKWSDVPGEQFFAVLRRRLGDLPLIAEDLGSITPEVELLREKCGFPGMRILQYGFGGDAFNRDLPHNYIQNMVAYTGTHDNDTTLGWYRSAPKNVKAHCRRYLPSNGRDIVADMIRAVIASVADIAIIPFQDVLRLDSSGRMNTPATEKGNWGWRFESSAISDETVEWLRSLAVEFGRV